MFPGLPGKIRVAILGPPGVGKGTLCKAFREKHAVSHLSVGDMLRQAVADLQVKLCENVSLILVFYR